MYLEQLSLWNFRKYGSNENLNRHPDLKIQFKEGVNLLIGENDSGKTAILDAIKIITLTRSNEYLRLQFEDFYHDGNADYPLTKLRIECIFAGFKDSEAKNFLEWISIRKLGRHDEFYLRVFLEADLKGAIVLPYEVKSGGDDEGSILTAGARDLIRATYLKPLRDAENELSPKRNSRLSQILDSHAAFENKIDHPLMTAMSAANTSIKNYFRGIDDQGDETEGHPGLNLTNSINGLLVSIR
jgi:putative ATP-dependent endonuclease of OLD family